MGVELQKIGRIFTIRWVASSHRAVNALWKSYPALYDHFLQLSENGKVKVADRAKYQGLVCKMPT